MKRLLLSIASVLCLSLAYAQVPGTFSYQGILVDGTGVPVGDGPHTVEFDFYDAPTGGAIKYDGTGVLNNVNTYKGMFTFIIGTGGASGHPIIPTNIWDNQVYLEVKADGVTLSPRVQLTSNPYAFKAENANSIVDNAVTSLKILDATIVAADIATGAVTSTKILDGEIVNADVNASAAIAGTKITPNFGAQNISTTGTVTATSFTGAGAGVTGLTAGNISGTVAVANGGTGAATAAAARTNLGLGSLSTLSAIGSTEITDGTIGVADLGTGSVNSTKILDGEIVNADINASAAIADSKLATISTAGKVSGSAITGAMSGTLSGASITGSVAVANGGTGATDAATARTNLGLTIGTNVQAPISASNGLTLSGTVVTLGGTLTGETTIASATNNLLFNGTGKLGIASPVPLSKLSVGANVAIGNTYAEGTAAPNNGLIVEGLVGIGTATPTRAFLEQHGQVASTSAIFGGNGQGVSLAINSPGVGFNTYFSGTGTRAIASGFGSSFTFNTATGDLYYYASTASGAADALLTTPNRLTILNNGNVGMGTSAPSVQLGVHVNSASFSRFKLSNSLSGSTITDGFGLEFSSDGISTQLWNYENGGLHFGTNNLERARINAAGNMGIGTNTPANKLDIEGGAVIGATYSGTNTAPTNGLLVEGNVGIGTSAPAIAPVIAGRTYLTIRGSTDAGVLELASGDPDAAGVRTGVIQFADVNSVAPTDKRLAGIAVVTEGTTANNRGGILEFSTKANGAAGLPIRMVINSVGNVAIGGTATPNPGARLTVDGAIATINGSPDFVTNTGEAWSWNHVNATTGAIEGPERMRLNSIGNLTVDGTITPSDIRLKENIAKLNYGLNEVLRLNPVSYTLKNRSDLKKKIGLIAQETLSIIPEVVVEPDQESKFYGVNYVELIPVLIKAMQEQQEQISDLKSQLTQYKDLSAQVEELKKLMAGKDTGTSTKTEVSGSHKK